MTERQRDTVSEIAGTIFHHLDFSRIIKDEEGNIVAGLRYGCSNNKDSWSYLYYNENGHLVSRPIIYCDNKDVVVNKKFYVDRGGDKPEVIK